MQYQPLERLPRDHMPDTTLYYGFTVTDNQLITALRNTGLWQDGANTRRNHHRSYHHDLTLHLYALSGVIEVARVFSDQEDSEVDAEWVIALERSDSNRNSTVRYDADKIQELQRTFGIEIPRQLKWYYDENTGMLSKVGNEFCAPVD